MTDITDMFHSLIGVFSICVNCGRLYQGVYRGAGRVSGQGGQNLARSAETLFRLPTLVFSLPTLPYVTVAHPAHRTEADLREKASLATNQEGPLPSLPSDLALQLGHTHAWSMTTGKR